MLNILFKIVLFIVGAGSVIVLEFLFISLINWILDIRLMPHGIGWIIIPIILGIHFSRNINKWIVEDNLLKVIYNKIKVLFRSSTEFTKICILFPIFWGICVISYILTFNPFGYSVSSSEWLLTIKVILFPSFIIYIAYLLYRIFLKQ